MNLAFFYSISNKDYDYNIQLCRLVSITKQGVLWPLCIPIRQNVAESLSNELPEQGNVNE